MKIKNFFLYLIFLIIIIFFCLFWGSVKISPSDAFTTILAFIKNGGFTSGFAQEQIILNIRLPRIFLAGISGAVLSICGICMQSITGNSLAEPYILGISSGASAGAVSAIILHLFSFFGTSNVYAGAFLGSLIATASVLLLQGKTRDPVRLILMGVGVNAFFSAITTYIIYSAKNEAQVRSAAFWSTGSLSGVQYSDLLLPLITLIILLIIVLSADKEFNLMLLGLDSAEDTGLNIKKMQLITIIVISAAVSVLVAKTGVIGFVGLIVPHIGRKFAGVKHRPLVIWSSIFGAAGLMLADTFARSIFSPSELPISVITGIAGAPLFIKILKKSL